MRMILWLDHATSGTVVFVAAVLDINRRDP
jgi:hypothetical protein